MKIHRIVASPYGVNCYIISCNNTKHTAIVDPGGNSHEILNFINQNQLDLKFIILTHTHGDHIGAVEEIAEKKKVPVFVHKADAPMLQDAKKNLTSLMGGPVIEITPDRLLEDGEIIELGDLKLHIIHTPGHTLGGICIKVNDVLFTGDTLFAGSIGRTDFEGGSFAQLIDSIKKKLLVFDDYIKVYPGHGPESSIGAEKSMNPFLR
jgi:hydroxyacylglutathione hydrolase